ncbi:MAG: biotin--[acetyl-CoA-carboxylase] ligase [Acidisphaera sp.]|nr:biotin--[acetyl-CoA-carboxylase] ligase [Acidisphaera sp.]
MAPAGYRVLDRARVGSTNDELRALACDGAPHGTVVRAAEQVAGRGRRGRTWQSAPGNLYLSVMLRSAHDARLTTQLGFVAGVAVADAVDAMLPSAVRARLKWPNDVLVQGGKIAGILVERLEAQDGAAAAIVGIGVNVDHAPSGLPYQATCLREHGGAEASLDTLTHAVLAALDDGWTAWLRDGFGAVRTRWRRRGPAVGDPLSVSLPDTTVLGTFADLDQDGALLLRVGDGVRRFVVGDAVPLLCSASASPVL